MRIHHVIGNRVLCPTNWDGEREKLPDCTYRLFEQTGHHMQFEQPVALGTARAEWLQSR